LALTNVQLRKVTTAKMPAISAKTILGAAILGTEMVIDIL